MARHFDVGITYAATQSVSLRRLHEQDHEDFDAGSEFTGQGDGVLVAGSGKLYHTSPQTENLFVER